MARQRMGVIPAFVLAAGTLHGVVGASDAVSDEAEQTMLDMRINAFVLMAGAKEGDGVLRAVQEEPAPLDAVVKQMEQLYRTRLALRDAWGNRLLFLGDSRSFRLLSVGPDGRLDESTETTEPKHYRPVSLVSDGDDIVLSSGGEFIKRPMTESEKEAARQKITMADIRSVATAIEEYAIDNNVYPDPTGGLVPLEAIRSLVEPIYIRIIPTEDAWGQPLLVWSTGRGYMLVSTGSDRVLDTPYDRSGDLDAAYGRGGPFTDPQTDIIFVDGQFVQWPEKTQQ